MIVVMLAPAPWMVFAGAPSGSTYQANQFALVTLNNNSAADVSFLQQAGCTPLTPFGAYQLPPQTAWKLAATGCQVLGNMTGLASGKLMSCLIHFATTPLSGLVRLTLANWIRLDNVGDYWDNAGPQNMGPITVNGTICYPGPNNVIGTYSAVQVAPGAMVDVTLNLSSTIPAGAKYYEGCFAQPTSGLQVPTRAGYYLTSAGPYDGNSEGPNIVLGEGAVLSTSATDQTANLSSISGTGTNVPSYGAVAICAVQPITQPVACVASADSLQAGFKCGTDAFGNVGPFAWGCGDLLPCLDMAVSGSTAAVNAGAGYAGTGYATAISAGLSLMEHVGVTHALVALGTNDFYAGTSAATIETDLTTLYDQFSDAGFVVCGATLPPRTTSTDNWETTTNQTKTSNETIRTTVNTWVRTNPSPLTNFMEFCASVESSVGSGLWAVNGTSEWGTLDGIHWGYSLALVAAQAVPVTSFDVDLPASVLAYVNTWARPITPNVQAALDYLLNPTNLGKMVKLGSATLNFDITTDQAIPLSGSANFVVSHVVVSNPSINQLTAAQGGFYASAGKNNALFGTTTTTAFSPVTGSGVGNGALVLGDNGTVRNPPEIYLSLTTAQGAAATAEVDVYGFNLAA